ncbi:MAG TPA: hypothetical protein VMF55_05035 [Solirubrobacterales bacterium]|nr:hypothetical protein [Solirubrobacterales bacterium]
MPTVTIPSRFNGPRASGNGGYSCGVIAAALDGPTAVSLRLPVPLDQELALRHEDDGKVCAFRDDKLIAEAVPAAPLSAWDGPLPSLDEARAGRERYAAPPDGEFGHCFVCGRSRADGFHLFSGPIAGADLVASPWSPPAWAAGDDGLVRPEFVWAALDCPGFFALHGAAMTIAYLARQQVEILAPVHAGVEYVVVGRPLERSGRKGLAATAVLDPDGTVIAHGECLLITPRASPPAAADVTRKRGYFV